MNLKNVYQNLEFESFEIWLLNYSKNFWSKIRPATLFTKFVLDQYYKKWDSPLWNMPISDFYDFTKYYFEKYSSESITESILSYRRLKKHNPLERTYITYETEFAKLLLNDSDINIEDGLKAIIKRKYNL